MTPPVVGWVRKEMYSPPASRKRWMAAEVLAICIRERIPSCIRAPPLAEKMMRGSLFRWAYSTQRVTFSPTAAPMLPIKKRLSRAAAATLRPSTRPRAVTTASIRPVLSRWRSSFSSYPGKPSTLGATRSWSSSRKLLESSSMASRR